MCFLLEDFASLATKMKLTYPTYLSKKEPIWENPTPFEKEVHFEAVDLAAGESTKGSRVSETKLRILRTEIW